ncbi:lipopolysaccharide core heptose(I) kinase RfaP, partial [Klebsiella pneumoniae]|nr:lipopolysaccharide core heptose(I) kinase RfaP [Klebsiella pneumoniae]
RVKRMLIKRVATMVRDMHAAGINHRDCYICHFLLHLPFSGKEEELKISVIDLHRAQLRTRVPRRWRDKDLIGLYFSSMNIGLTQRDIWRFMKVYFAAPLKD